MTGVETKKKLLPEQREELLGALRPLIVDCQKCFHLLPAGGAREILRQHYNPPGQARMPVNAGLAKNKSRE
jgi:hypothetical protein